jgi:hypothetical protein
MVLDAMCAQLTDQIHSVQSMKSKDKEKEPPPISIWPSLCLQHLLSLAQLPHSVVNTGLCIGTILQFDISLRAFEISPSTHNNSLLATANSNLTISESVSTPASTSSLTSTSGVITDPTDFTITEITELSDLRHDLLNDLVYTTWQEPFSSTFKPGIAISYGTKSHVFLYRYYYLIVANGSVNSFGIDITIRCNRKHYETFQAATDEATTTDGYRIDFVPRPSLIPVSVLWKVFCHKLNAANDAYVKACEAARIHLGDNSGYPPFRFDDNNLPVPISIDRVFRERCMPQDGRKGGLVEYGVSTQSGALILHVLKGQLK